VNSTDTTTPATPIRANRSVGVLAFISLVSALVALVNDNGGLAFHWTPYVAVLVLLGFPALTSEVRQWPKSVRAGFLVLVLATTLSMLYGPNRSWFPATLIIESGMFIVAGAAGYLWRHRPRLVYAALAVTAAVWAVKAFTNWLVVLDPSQPRQLRPLGWHNPSAVFYGSLALMALSTALLSSSKVRAIMLALCAGAGAGAVYLTTSRGGEIVFLIGTIVVLVLARPTWRGLVKTGLYSALSMVVTIVFFHLIAPAPKVGGAMPYGTAAARATGHIASATGDFGLRVMYWKTAIRMFEHFWLFGAGPGSWFEVSWRYISTNEDFSTATHNWYLQTFAEQGVIAGLALVVLTSVVCVGALRVRRWATPTALPLATGAAGAVVMFSLHNGIDFDNRWPVAMWLLAAMCGILAASRPTVNTPSRRNPLTLVSLALSMVLMLGGIFVGAQITTALGSPLGHDLVFNVPAALASAQADLNHFQNGHHAPLGGQALIVIDEALAYNPGEPRLEFMRKVIGFYGLQVTPKELLRALENQGNDPWAASFPITAAAFADHQLWTFEARAAADGILQANRHSGWDALGSFRAQLYSVELQGVQAAYPCNAAIQEPILRAQASLISTTSTGTANSIKNIEAQVSHGCPNLASFVKSLVK